MNLSLFFQKHLTASGRSLLVFPKNLSTFLEVKLLRDASALYFSRGLNLAVSIGSTIVYGILFSKSQIAVINLFEMLTNLFLSFGFTWSTLGITQFGRVEYLKSRSLSYVSSIRLSIIFPLLVAVLIFFFLFSTSLSEYILVTDPKIIFYLAVTLLLSVFHEHLSTLLTTAENHIANSIFFFSQSLGKLFILLIFYLGLVDVSAEFFIKANAYLLSGLLIFRFFFIDKSLLFPIKFIFNADSMDFFKFVYPQILGFAGIYVINWVDVYFIRKYGTFDDLGGYQFLYSIFMKICYFAFILNALFYPKIIAWINSDEKKIKSFLTHSPYLLILLTGALTVFFLCLYKPLFSFAFGEKYANAYPAFNILLGSIPFYFLSSLFVPVLNAYHKVKYIQIVNVVSAFINFLIDLFFIPKYGIMAAAMGTYTAYLLRFIMLTVPARKLFALKYTLIDVLCFGASAFIFLYFHFH